MFSLVLQILDGVPFEVRQGHLRRIPKVWLISHTNMAAIYPTSKRWSSAAPRCGVGCNDLLGRTRHNNEISGKFGHNLIVVVFLGKITPPTCAFLTNPEAQRPRVSASLRRWLENSEPPPATAES